MNIIKRDGKEVVFDVMKIIEAISKANEEVDPGTPDNPNRLSKKEIVSIATDIENYYKKCNHVATVEDVQDRVEKAIVNKNKYDVAKAYIIYRYNRALVRKNSEFDDHILSIINRNNEKILQENSNKNPIINSVQRDYVAGEISRDITSRLLLDKDIREAHENGLLHFHDADYFIQFMHNCCLINLEDMLQNGTVISGVGIDKPNSFSTACNVATQIIAQVASQQYGGQSISLSHLAPFVDVSRQKFIKEVRKELMDNYIHTSFEKEEKFEALVENIAEERVMKEINKGVQTIQYQVVTLMTTNGQAPFITVFMYLNEVDDPQTKHDLALIIEEVLKQRYLGVKNEKGIYISPAFPKLIYVLEEDNITEDSKYWYLTELAAKCSAKRLVPDYISEKKMLEYKVDKNGEGHCYTPMGCRSFLTPYVDENNKPKYYGRFNQGKH